MKLTKSVLAGVVATVSAASINLSCEKEVIAQEPESRIERMNHEQPVCGFGEEEPEPIRFVGHYDCPACGMG